MNTLTFATSNVRGLIIKDQFDDILVNTSTKIAATSELINKSK
jgi:hypothetical protein